MRLRLLFSSVGNIKLSWNYPEGLQALVYRWISAADNQLAQALHDEGYAVGKHRYKLFVYSLLHAERCQGSREGVELGGRVRWWIASPRMELIEALAIGLLRYDEVSLEQNQLRLEEVDVEPLPVFGAKMCLRTLSPVVVSTVFEQGGQLKKKFLAPEEAQFGQVLGENLRRKALLLGIETQAVLRFEPIVMRSRLFCFHGTYVRGWEGWFFVEGEAALLRVGYEAGFGERNGQGFGMVEVCRRSPRPNPEPGVDCIGRQKSNGN